MTNKLRHEIATHGAKRFLTRNGFEILDVESNFDIVCKAEEEGEKFISIVNVYVVDEFKEGHIASRSEVENAMFTLFVDNDEALERDIAIRYDEIQTLVLSGGRALIRFRQNALGVEEVA